MKLTPQQIVERMWGEDAFSKELGMEILDLGAGFCSVRLHVNPSMVNGIRWLLYSKEPFFIRMNRGVEAN